MLSKYGATSINQGTRFHNFFHPLIHRDFHFHFLFLGALKSRRFA